MDTIFIKTALGQEEMRSRALGLPILERRLLILADGKRTVAQLQTLFDVSVAQLSAKLQTLGLIEDVTPHQQPLVPDGDTDMDDALAEDLASDFAEELSSEFLSESMPSSSTGQGDTLPGELTHRSASAQGIAAAKADLTETIQTILGAKGKWLLRKTLDAQTEGDLYYALELFVTTIRVYSSASTVSSIIRRFEKLISQR
jgi:hypothetical protein